MKLSILILLFLNSDINEHADIKKMDTKGKVDIINRSEGKLNSSSSDIKIEIEDE